MSRIAGTFCDKGALGSPTVTPPGAPDLNAASDSRSSPNDNNTNVQKPTFNGSCATGTQIQLQLPFDVAIDLLFRNGFE